MGRHPSRFADGGNKFGKLIRARREELGLDQGEVGRALGLGSGNYISAIERGEKTAPSTLNLIRLAMILRFDFEDFLISAGVLEQCDNLSKLRLNRAVAFVEAWESSLEIKESVRLSRMQLQAAMAFGGIPEHSKKLIRLAMKNLDYLYNICFDIKRPVSRKHLTII